MSLNVHNLKLASFFCILLFPFFLSCTPHMPTLAPAPKDIGESSSLEDLYKDLDLYMKELDKQVAATTTTTTPPAAAVSQIAFISINTKY